MKTPANTGTATTAKTHRVAIYTRQSVASDLQFGSIDAQREAVEAYIHSQRGNGWVALRTRYDDGGFSGSNTDRPALQRLLADAKAGKLDAIAVYRLDRISRSMADLTNLILDLERLGVAFVSTTESFDTASPVGRLLLNILGSFAQFERESIASRTRDKIHATRRRGMWTGGRPILGFDVIDKRLIINVAEAATVREIAAIYLRSNGLLVTCAEIDRRGIRNKRWKNAAGNLVGGSRFGKTTLHHLLRNPILGGKVRCGEELVLGQHEAVLDEATFAAVQAKLAEHRRASVRPFRNKGGGLLSGLLRCACGAAMVHTLTRRRVCNYRYYTCRTAEQRGASACPGSRVPAPAVEKVVVGKIRDLGRDGGLQRATAAALEQDRKLRQAEANAAVVRLEHERGRIAQEQQRLLDVVARGESSLPAVNERLDSYGRELAELDQRIAETRAELDHLDAAADPVGLVTALTEFGPVWDALRPGEKGRVLRLLVEQVRYDAANGELHIHFREHGLRSLPQQPQTARTA